MHGKPSPGSSRRRAPYTNRACNSCRRLRCKCDGAHPVCGACLYSGHECTWSEVDGDNRATSKQYIEGLRVKIQLLESEISRLRLLDSETEQLSQNSTPTGDLTVLSWAGESPESITESPLRNSYQLTTNDFDSPPAWANAPPGLPPMLYQYIFNINMFVPIESQAPEVQASLACEWNRYLPLLGGATMSRQEHDTILSRCFDYGTTWTVGLIPNLFLRDLLHSNSLPPHQARLEHYSPMLHCSLLALAAAFSDDPGVRDLSTRARFAAHAKQWLDNDGDYTSLHVAIALALLSEYHRGIGQNHASNMYLGMSARVAHNPFESHDSTFQKWYRWAEFTQNTLMALESKSFPDAHIPQSPTDYPSTTELSNCVNIMILECEAINIDRSLSECLNRSCTLLAIAMQMANNVPQLTLGTANIRAQLDAWLDALPGCLCVREPSALTLPRVLYLHICYWWIVLESNLPQLISPHPEPAESLAIIQTCGRATDQIFYLVTLFGAQHGLQFFPRASFQAMYVCGAASVITRQWETARRCAGTLRTLNNVWPSAGALAGKLEGSIREAFNSTGVGNPQGPAPPVPNPHLQ